MNCKFREIELCKFFRILIFSTSVEFEYSIIYDAINDHKHSLLAYGRFLPEIYMNSRKPYPYDISCSKTCALVTGLLVLFFF